jgi:hypothetical protein
MNKVKISMTVTEETARRLDDLARDLFPHVSVSRGDVVDFLVGEKVHGKKMTVGAGDCADDKPAGEWIEGE